MLKSIQYCFKNNKVVSLYCDQEDTNSHLTGYINYYNNSELLISHINKRGEYDGFIIKHLEDVYRIHYDGDYEKKIEILYKLKTQTHPIIDAKDEGILFPLLDYAIKMDFIVTLELKDNYISGFINGYDDNFIQICIVNQKGINDGISVVNIDEIIAFSCDTDDEQDLKLLYTNVHGAQNEGTINNS